MKKIDIRVYIIIVLSIILSVLLYFYFRDDSTSNFDFSSFSRSGQKTSESKDSVSITASSQVSSALSEELRLHATYYFSKVLVNKNQYVKKGTKIIEYTNGTYLTAPYDLVVTDYKVPSSKSMCTTEHYVKVSSFNVLSVSFRVSEEKISAVSLGQEVKVRFPALNDKELTGFVTDISSTAENGRFTVTVEFDNDGDIRIGMSVTVSI